MATLKVLVLRAPGINCDEETAFAWREVGAYVEVIHVNAMIKSPHLLRDFQILTIPGGFSYGDDIASGKILANQLATHLHDALSNFVDRGGVVLGICNGLQVLVRLGLLPGKGAGVALTMAHNDSGRYEDRWVHIEVQKSNCSIFEPGQRFCLPVGHGEGKVLAASEPEASALLQQRGRILVKYVNASGGSTTYPSNPNGSLADAAGLTDQTGRIIGLMPHPDRNLFPSRSSPENPVFNTETDGFQFFRSIVRCLT
jgi:phosphoribosylformylglycinamidine synthase